MDDYALEMDELKSLVAATLEKKGILSRIRAELRASVFEAIEERDRAAGPGEDMAVVGGCTDAARSLHASPKGKLLVRLICEYLDWCGLDHTLKVYIPEANLPEMARPREDLESELGMARTWDSSAKQPLLAEVLNFYLQGKTSEEKEDLDWEGGSSARLRHGQRPATSHVPMSSGWDSGGDVARPDSSPSAFGAYRDSLDVPGSRESARSRTASGTSLPRGSDADDTPPSSVGRKAGGLSHLDNLPPLVGRSGGSLPSFGRRSGGPAALSPMHSPTAGPSLDNILGVSAADPPPPRPTSLSHDNPRDPPGSLPGPSSSAPFRPRHLQVPEPSGSLSKPASKSPEGLLEEDSYNFDQDIEEVIEEEDLDLDGAELDYGGSEESYTYDMRRRLAQQHQKQTTPGGS